MHSSCCRIATKVFTLLVSLTVCFVFIGDKMVSAQTGSPDEGQPVVGNPEKQNDMPLPSKEKDEKVSPENEAPKISLSRTAPKEGIVIRAERIEAQGLIPSLAITENGRLAVRLFAKKAKIYNMEMGIGSGQWGMDIQDAGPVLIQGLVADATALGFKIKGTLLQLDNPLPAVVLYDVYLKVEQMDADQVRMPEVNLQTKQNVTLSSNAVLDMGKLPKENGLKTLKDTVNDLLAGLSGFDSSNRSPRTRSDDSLNQPSLSKENPRQPSKKPPVHESDSDPPSDSPNDLPKPPSLPPSEEGDVIGKGKSVVKKVVVKLKDGPDHVLTVPWFVREAQKYDHTKITIQKGNHKADAKKLSEVLSMYLTPGTEIILTAEGKEAEQAVKDLVSLISGNHGLRSANVRERLDEFLLP